MDKCEQELLQYKLRELFCEKDCCHDDCCDVCVVDCCDNKKRDCDYCDCCVKPIKYLLRQFTPGSPIAVFTDDGMVYGDVYATAFFVSVDDSILTIRVQYGAPENSYIEKISICHIVMVYSYDILEATLLENKCGYNRGYCKCCAKPMNDQFKAYIGLYIDNIYLEGYWSEYGTIQRVSDGIAIVDGFIAIATCKVTNIEIAKGNISPGFKVPEKKKVQKTTDIRKSFETKK